MPPLAEQIAARKPEGRRMLVAIAGPPGAGKSTLARSLVGELGSACVLEMDGFHLDNALLAEAGLLARKGAPETFDAAGFVHLIERVRSGERGVIHPRFDRARDMAIAGAARIDDDARYLVIEGNYLLIEREPWLAARAAYDLAIFLAPPIETLRERLIQRWLDHGLDRDAAIARAQSNDIPNAEFTLAHSSAADITIDG